jgi:transposase
MYSIHTGNRYLLYHRWADVRKSFDGLSGIVTNELKMPIEPGDVFVFLNKRKTHIKLLQWEGDGYSLYYKRLEKGTFELPLWAAEGSHSVLTARQLMLILQGISLRKVVYRKRYIPSQAI